ncbi:hypothetical protein BJV77DRAFT_963876 [Russula vinacea]|nr:hypothetical protein BJV77DRAFT_963876 [Russula vinacea]
MSGLSIFKQSFKGDIVTPDDDGYFKAIARWAANAERPARVVAFVKDTDDIALALKYAQTNKLQVASSGASSAEDGLVIDLSRYFNYVVVDPEKRTARVGEAPCGGRSKMKPFNTDWPLQGYLGMSAVTHGIESLLLGGGFGFLTGQHGLVIDNLLQRRTVFGGNVIFPASVLDDLMKDFILLTLFYDGSNKKGARISRNFMISNEIFSHGSNYHLRVFSSLVPSPKSRRAFARGFLSSMRRPGTKSNTATYSSTSLTASCSPSRGRDRFSPHPSGNDGVRFEMDQEYTWIEDAAKRAARELTSIVAQAEAQVSGEDNNSGYGNFKNVNGVQMLDDSNSRVLFGPNYGRLQRLKAQYDPENVFSKWFPIIPNPDA